MTILSNYKCISLTVLAALLAACTSEVRDEGRGNLPLPDGGDPAATSRREVLLSLKNQLSVGNTSSTKAETIATPGENKISTLDVYVFGSPTEDGTYVYQERFAYRETGALPAGATKLELEPRGDEGKETTALLSLKKGLYVKLYCIANQPGLINPADETKLVSDDDFIPLQLSVPANGPVSIVGTGAAPEESTFLTFHTPLLDATAAGDTLVCPLPMSGAYTTPLDLTDFATSARMQAGFKLTRMVARFDIINNAAASRFTITEVSMGKGRRGAGFFPVKVYGTQPTAAAGELITYPARVFWGEKANAGIQTGAFYCYPSPEQDQAYLVLKGKYKVNQTEEKDVTYQVPFRSVSDGNGNYIEIAHNHRYTVAITDADEYHLDFTIRVSDWADDGSIDDYEPDNTPTIFEVTIPDTYQDLTEWNADTRTVNMSTKNGSSFSVSIGSNSAVNVSKTYAGNTKEYDWLVVAEPVITTKAETNSTYGYEFSINPDYKGTRFPQAIVRFTDVATGNENVLIVHAITAPLIEKVSKLPNDKIPNSVDPVTTIASIYRVSGSSLYVKLVCSEGVEMVSKPDWINVDLVPEYLPESIYALVLTNRDVEETEGKIVFRNKKVTSLETIVTVQLQEPISPLTDINMDLIDNKVVATESITSLEGFTLSNEEIDWGTNGVAWFKLNTTDVAKDGPVTLQAQLASVDPGKVKKATVKLRNKATGERDQTLTVIPVWQAPTVKSGSTTLNILCYKTATFTVNVPFGGIAATSSNANYVSISTNTGTGAISYTGKYYNVRGGSQTATVTVTNAKASDKKIIYTVNAQNLEWATGNLVASGANDAKIGQPTDYGLLFRWGSLIGYDTYSAGNATAAVTPPGYTGGRPVFTASPNNGNTNNTNLAAGTGDACKAYLGGKWRMPTVNEYRQMGGNISGNSTFSPWKWTSRSGVYGVETGPGYALFFPASGYRERNSGVPGKQGSEALAWSSSSFYRLFGFSTNLNIYSVERSWGMPIRCVREP